MNSAFDPSTGAWNIAWPGRVARHDLVYLSPPEDPTQGIPLGNGDVGVLVWTEDSRIVMVLNKCDLLDDATFEGPLRSWAPEQEDYSAALRHGGRIILDFGLPLCDSFFLSDFDARLSLADATLHLSANGPLGRVSLRAFVNHDCGALCAEVACDLAEPAAIEITVERYGSRTYGHWYEQINRDAGIGLSGTAATVDDQGACITHRLSTGTFALGCRVSASTAGPGDWSREHSHACKLRLPRAAQQRFSLAAALTAPLAEGAPALAAAQLERCAACGIDAMHRRHAAAWQAFWQRSLMESGDDYLDNLWHLTMYYAYASQRGRYPGRFIHGLWTFSHDTQLWTFYFHWNQQELYWPLNAAGHHDLLDSYLAYRYDALPYGKADARQALGADGALVSDVADWRGRNSASEFLNHTPVAQIAMDFWRQYQYTGDAAFLRQRALPYMLEAARFFESLFVLEPDGLYHAREGTGYEGWIKLHDAITELVCGRVLFAAVLAALREAGVSEPRAEHWQHILEHLAPLPQTEPADIVTADGDELLLKRGHFRGQLALSRRTLAAGWGLEEQRMLCSKLPAEPSRDPYPDTYTTLHRMERNHTNYTSLREDMKVLDGIFPFVEYSAVYPSGLIGLGQRGSDDWALAANTAKLYAPDCMGWDPLPIVLARLGLRDELAEILRHWPARWQFYCNGFGHYGPRDIQKAEASLRFRTDQVRDAANPDGPRFPFSVWPFRHMGMESMSVLACAMNEALLQSHDGVLRIAPAAASTGHARFSLHAVGGFVVSAEVEDGAPLWVYVESRRGGECVLENPWPQAHIRRNGQACAEEEAHLLRIGTAPGDKLLFTPNAQAAADWNVVPLECAANAAAKLCPDGWAQLGLPRMF